MTVKPRTPRPPSGAHLPTRLPYFLVLPLKVWQAARPGGSQTEDALLRHCRSLQGIVCQANMKVLGRLLRRLGQSPLVRCSA